MESEFLPPHLPGSSGLTPSRWIEPASLEGEVAIEVSLRPQRLEDYVGQDRIKDKLKLLIDAAQLRGDALDHVLLAGPPGLGKTTLSQIIAQEMGAQIHFLTGPNVEKKGDLAAVLTNLQPGDVVFIDEIHRLPKPIEEVLYSAMEDFKLDLIMGQGPSARTLRLDIPRFTLVGATTRTGLLTNPLRDRFGLELRLDFYPVPELTAIVERSSRLLEVEVHPEAAREVATRARGTPRIANRLLRRVRDFAMVRANETRSGPAGRTKIDHEHALRALLLLEVDPKGLDFLDRKYLALIAEKFAGGPVGIETLCAALQEQRDTLEEVVEPYLLQQGFIQRTPRGRMLSDIAWVHLGVESGQK